MQQVGTTGVIVENNKTALLTDTAVPEDIRVEEEQKNVDSGRYARNKNKKSDGKT